MAASMVSVERDFSSDSEGLDEDPDGVSDVSDTDGSEKEFSGGGSKSGDSSDVIEEDEEESNFGDCDPVDEDEEETTVSGLGDVMSKILHKNIDTSSSVILAKSETDRQISRKRKLALDNGNVSKTVKVSTDVDNEESDEETSGQTADPWRVKPNPLKKDHERLLQRISTKGVVQLFNAVQKQQKTIDAKLSEAGSSQIKKERAMKSITKGGFVDMLKKNDKTANSATMVVDSEPSWKILSDNFMMGAKLKDWDKNSDDENVE